MPRVDRATPPTGNHPQPDRIGALAGGIAHDFNNLMVGVVGNADLARLVLPTDSPALAALDKITDSAARAASLCGELLAYAGRGPFERRSVDLVALIGELTPQLRRTMPAGATLELQLQTRLPPIYADAEQVRQALHSLIRNAVEALGCAGGRVRIAATRVRPDDPVPEDATVEGTLPARASVRVCVSDTGPGIDDITRARMFEPFFSRKPGARGLGLPATRGIVLRHGGALLVHGPRVDDTQANLGGSTFELRLPAASVIADRPPRKRLASLLQGAVLVVDDEPLVRDVVSQILTREGLAVLSADDGQRALDVFGAHADEIGLVLLDLTMPTMGGRSALLRLRAAAPGLPVVLMSGYHEQRVDPQADDLATGPVGFVQKPFRRYALLDAIRTELARAARD